ncbi:hypothetical protein N7470_005705 [Penicillium chermesinum]|nr:hypothetical protein N7470_005705 [Penicillium chermesinum]
MRRGLESHQTSSWTNILATSTLIKFLAWSGSFQWGGVNFSKDARNTRLTTEGPNHQVILHSELKNLSGDYVGDHLDLSPYITNTNGTLHFAHEDP